MAEKLGNGGNGLEKFSLEDGKYVADGIPNSDGLLSNADKKVLGASTPSLKKASGLKIDINSLKKIGLEKSKFRESDISIMRKIYEGYKNNGLLDIARKAKAYYCGSSRSFHLNGCLRKSNFLGRVQDLTKLDSEDLQIIGLLDKLTSSPLSKVGKRITVTRRVDTDYFNFLSKKINDETLKKLSMEANVYDYSSMQKLADYININYKGLKNIDEGYSSVNFEETMAYSGFRSRICTLSIDLKPDDHVFATGYENESEGILARGNGMIFKEAKVIQEGNKFKLNIRCAYDDPANRKEGSVL